MREENSGPGSRTSPEEVNLLDNLRTIVRTAREAGIAIYHVPHHRWEPGDYADWKYPSPYQLGAAERQAFAKDTWGGTFHNDFQVQPGDIVATEHWASSGFPNTDLEHKLKRYGKEKIICIGLLANTCLEATARVGMELGFHVTLVRDGTAARSHEALHATLDIDGPTFAHEILTTAELVWQSDAPCLPTNPQPKRFSPNASSDRRRWTEGRHNLRAGPQIPAPSPGYPKPQIIAPTWGCTSAIAQATRILETIDADALLLAITRGAGVRHSAGPRY